MATPRAELNVILASYLDGIIAQQWPANPRISWIPGKAAGSAGEAFTGNRERFSIAAAGTATITIPAGAQVLCIELAGKASVRLVDSGGVTIAALTSSSPAGIPLLLPLDQSITATLYLKNSGSSTVDLEALWL